MKEFENVELARRNSQLVPMDLSATGSQDQKSSKETVHGVDFTETWPQIVERKPNTCKTNKQTNKQTSGWSGTDDKGKGKPSMGSGKGKQDKGKGNGKPGKGTGKNKDKGEGEHHGKKG